LKYASKQFDFDWEVVMQAFNKIITSKIIYILNERGLKND
jgi:hypothetical protein